MLNRRILRIKAFKAIYSYAENPSMTLAEVQSQLETSCEAARSLYLKMLAIIPCLTDEALSRIEAAKTKFVQTEEERNPNMKFVENAIAPLLRDDPDLTKILSRRKLGWENCDAFIRNVFSSISRAPTERIVPYRTATRKKLNMKCRSTIPSRKEMGTEKYPMTSNTGPISSKIQKYGRQNMPTRP